MYLVVECRTDVGAERQRLLQVRARRRCCPPAAARRALVRDLGQRGDVGDVQQRVGRRLAPDHLGGRADRRPDRVQVGQRQRGVRQIPTARRSCRPAGTCRRRRRRAGSGGRRAAARPGAGVGRRPSRRRTRSRTAALEGGQRVLQRGPGRVAGAGVLVAGAGLADPVLGERRRLVDRHDHRAGRRIRVLAGVDGAGGETAVTAGAHQVVAMRVRGDAGGGHPDKGRADAATGPPQVPGRRGSCRRSWSSGSRWSPPGIADPRRGGAAPTARPGHGAARAQTAIPPQYSGQLSIGSAQVRRSRRRTGRRASSPVAISAPNITAPRPRRNSTSNRAQRQEQDGDESSQPTVAIDRDAGRCPARSLEVERSCQ